MSRVFLGRTKGYFNPKLTAEDVRDNWDRINDQTGYDVPKGVAGEIQILLRTFKDATT